MVWRPANIELYRFERTVFENKWDGLTTSNANASKNKFVKKPTALNSTKHTLTCPKMTLHQNGQNGQEKCKENHSEKG